MNEEIRVVIADDEEGMRLIERKIIARVEGMKLVGEATNGRELVELVEKMKPQLVFLDVEMPEMTGVECARAIQDMDPGTIIILPPPMIPTWAMRSRSMRLIICSNPSRWKGSFRRWNAPESG